MNQAALWSLVAVAGAAGAATRYIVDFAISDRTAGLFPWGTFTVNVSGSLMFGLAAGAVVPADLQLIVASGYCGAYTTFSTHMVESIAMLEERARRRVVANVVGSLVAGVLAAVVGVTVGVTLTEWVR